MLPRISSSSERRHVFVLSDFVRFKSMPICCPKSPLAQPNVHTVAFAWWSASALGSKDIVDQACCTVWRALPSSGS